MLFKYWISFDDEGNITGLYESKTDCDGPCKEYIVKLIPIDRKLEDIKEKSSDFAKSAEKASQSMKRFRTEFEKTTRDLRRIKI